MQECSRAEDQRGEYTLSQHPDQLAGLVDHLAMERHLAMHNSAALAAAQQAPQVSEEAPGLNGEQGSQQNGAAVQQQQQQPQLGQPNGALSEQERQQGGATGQAAVAEEGAEGEGQRDEETPAADAAPVQT